MKIYGYKIKPLWQWPNKNWKKSKFNPLSGFLFNQHNTFLPRGKTFIIRNVKLCLGFSIWVFLLFPGRNSASKMKQHMSKMNRLNFHSRDSSAFRSPPSPKTKAMMVLPLNIDCIVAGQHYFGLSSGEFNADKGQSKWWKSWGNRNSGICWGLQPCCQFSTL